MFLEFPGPIRHQEWQKTDIPASLYRIYGDVVMVPHEGRTWELKSVDRGGAAFLTGQSLLEW